MERVFRYETLIESFKIFGVLKTLNLIGGMFSIFLFDIRKNEFYLINDILVKNHYYEVSNNSFLISSSLNSFLLEKRN